MNFPYGEITPDPPPNFAPPEVWPEFGAVAQPTSVCAREEVGQKPRGVRWSLWPLTFEEYWGDQEPDVKAAAKGSLVRNRLVGWRRVSRSDVPAGWRTLSRRPGRVDGFYILGNTADYRADWSGNARRNYKKWAAACDTGDYAVEPIDFKEYKRAYARSTARKKTGLEYIDVLERKLALPSCKDHYSLWGVLNKKTGAIIAGYVRCHSPTYRSSTREFPFILSEGKKIYAAVGLMDHWVRHSLGAGVELLVTASFWHPGEPKSWKGFSAFKAQFGYTYVAYPPTLWKFVRGKIF